MRKPFLLCLTGALVVQLAAAQSPDILTVRKYAAKNAVNTIHEFVELLTIPNVAADPAGLQKNIDKEAPPLPFPGNGNIRLSNLFDGIETMAAIMLMSNKN